MGFVYFIERSDTGAIKIGTSADPQKRLAAIRAAAGCACVLLVVVPGGVGVERMLHRRFGSTRLHGFRGATGDTEWFALSNELADFIDRAKANPAAALAGVSGDDDPSVNPIVALRQRHGMSRVEFATHLGVGYSILGHVEIGVLVRIPPSVAKGLIAKGVDVAEMQRRLSAWASLQREDILRRCPGTPLPQVYAIGPSAGP